VPARARRDGGNPLLSSIRRRAQTRTQRKCRGGDPRTVGQGRHHPAALAGQHPGGGPQGQHPRPRLQHLPVGAHRRRSPHRRVHGGGNQYRRFTGQQRAGQQGVAEAMHPA
ncbi:MAG: hypothetical protein ACK55I_29665, partial [bacterium]